MFGGSEIAWDEAGPKNQAGRKDEVSVSERIVAVAVQIMPSVVGSVNPVAGFRFGVEIADRTVAWFTDCSGLTIERTVYSYEEGGVNSYVHQLPDRIKYTNVVLKRGIGDETLWQWFQKGLYDAKIERKNISILLYSTDRQSVKRWNLVRAFPVKWSGPEFKADSNQIAIETLDIVHEGMAVTGWE